MFGISLGIGVACMDMIGNMFAGLFLITNKEFKLKNIIEVKHKGKIYFGRLENITMRYTVVRLLSRERVVFPNLYMILNPIITFDSDPIVKLQFTMNIHANTPLPW